MGIIESLVKDLINHKSNYYNGKPTISDDQFDTLEKKLEELDPNNIYFDKVGSDDLSVDGIEINHKVPMLSMKKVKESESAKQWMISLLSKYNHILLKDMDKHYFLIEPKIDGVSCTIKYDDQGRFMYMATRGNGSIGNKVNFGEKILQNNGLPRLLYRGNTKDADLLLGNEIELRGEFYINKNTKGYGPLRNAVAGLISRKEETKELEDIKICLYSIVNNDSNKFVSYGQYFPESIDKNKTIVNFSTKCTPNEINKIYDEYNLKIREQLPFETDGLVIYYPHEDMYDIIDADYKEKSCHHYVLALKPPSKSQMSKVTSITFNISKYGFLIPVINVEPVMIADRKYQNVSLTNWDNLLNKGIKINSTVMISIAQDIIPYLSRYLPQLSENEKDVEEPTICPECGSKVYKNGKNLVCSNRFCSGVLTSRIVFLNKNMKVKGLADAITSTIIKYFKLKYLTEFYNILITDNKECQDLIGEKVYNNIKEMIFKQFPKFNDKTLLAYAANIPSLGIKELDKDLEFKDIDDFLERCIANPNSAVKRNIVDWYNSNDYYIEFKDFVKFVKENFIFKN